jgi:hypothetical protein
MDGKWLGNSLYLSMDGPTKYDEQIAPVIQAYCSVNYPMLLPQLLPHFIGEFHWKEQNSNAHHEKGAPRLVFTSIKMHDQTV